MIFQTRSKLYKKFSGQN
ncbi:MAG: hypothetical protein ACLS98_06415 [Anaerobutyricum soehngenii]